MSEKLTDEILTLLLQRLPADFAAIRHEYDTRNYAELLKHVHKLHGVVCYTRETELRRVLAELEGELKKGAQDERVDGLMGELSEMIRGLLQEK